MTSAGVRPTASREYTAATSAILFRFFRSSSRRRPLAADSATDGFRPPFFARLRVSGRSPSGRITTPDPSNVSTIRCFRFSAWTGLSK